MPGNLNAKKSWHPGLLKNKAVVWSKEQDAIAERKKILERQKEIQQERERNELLAMQEAATGQKRTPRMEWMYSGVSTGGNRNGDMDDAEAEDYLLGKRRIDDMFRGGENNELLKDKVAERFGAKDDEATDDVSNPTIRVKDLDKKDKSDPMSAILAKQRVIASYQAKSKDQKGEGEGEGEAKYRDERSASSKSRSRHEGERSRRSRDYEDSRSRHSQKDERHSKSSRRREYSDEERESRHRSKRQYDDDSDYEDRRSQRHSRSKSHGEYHSRHSRSRSSRSEKYPRESSLSPERSRSSKEPRRHRSRSPPREDRHGKRYREGDYYSSSTRSRSSTDGSKDKSQKDKERERKLQQMMADAQNLESKREERISQYSSRERTLDTEEKKDRKKDGRDSIGEFVMKSRSRLLN